MLARVAYGASSVGVAYAVSGLMLLWWAFCLLARDPGMLTKANAYHVLAELAPASFWGAVCLVIGVVQVVAFFRAWPRPMAVAGVLAACWWATIASGFWAVQVPTTAEGVYSIMAGVQLWAAYIMRKAW